MEAFQDAIVTPKDMEDLCILALADAENGCNNLGFLSMLWDV